MEKSILTNKQKSLARQSTKNLISRQRPVMRRRQHKTWQSRLDPVLEHCRRKLIRIQELPREVERVPGTEQRPRMTKGRWSNPSGPANWAHREFFKE